MCFAKSRKLKALIGAAAKQSLDHFCLYNLKLGDTAVNLYVSKKRATKATHIHCTAGGDILWEQFYPFGGMSTPSREKKFALKPIRDKTAITLVVIRGEPGSIIGLDDGVFRSDLSVPKTNYIYLMQEALALNFLEAFSS